MKCVWGSSQCENDAACLVSSALGWERRPVCRRHAEIAITTVWFDGDTVTVRPLDTTHER